MTANVLIAGFGQMGKYYAEKLTRHADAWDVRIAGIVDSDVTRFDLGISPLKGADADLLKQALQSTTCFTDIQSALARTMPDIIINATNSDAHIEIIRAQKIYPNLTGFFSEKPLVEEKEDEAEATDTLKSRYVSMNMVTNFSAAAQGLRTWLAQHKNLKPIGMEGVWGKDRRSDKRPTPGIASDMVHPVGLIQAVFGNQRWSFQRASGFYGHLSMDRDGQNVDCVYHYDAAFKTSKGPVRMEASYAWDQQVRRVTGFFEEKDGHYKIAELLIDEAIAPGSKTRVDFYRIFNLSSDFRKIELVEQSEPSAEDKLSAYLRLSLEGWKTNQAAGQAGLIGLKEEYDIGRMYGALHPSGNIKDFTKASGLTITHKDAAVAPVRPVLTTVNAASAVELEDRIMVLKTMALKR